MNAQQRVDVPPALEGHAAAAHFLKKPSFRKRNFGSPTSLLLLFTRMLVVKPGRGGGGSWLQVGSSLLMSKRRPAESRGQAQEEGCFSSGFNVAGS